MKNEKKNVQQEETAQSQGFWSILFHGDKDMFRPGDKYIWGALIAICLYSALQTYSAASRAIDNPDVNPMTSIYSHWVFLALALGVAWLVQRYRYQRFIVPTYAFLGIMFVCFICVEAGFGTRINGATRSLNVLGITIQPAELAKLVLTVFSSIVLAQNITKTGVRKKGFWTVSGFTAVAVAFTVQHGGTNTILLFLMVLGVMVIAGCWPKLTDYIKGATLFLIATAIIAFIFWGTIVKWISANATEDEATKTETITVQNIQDADTEWSYATDTIATQDEKVRTSTWTNRVKRYLDSTPLWQRTTTEDGGKYSQEIYARLAQANGGFWGVGLGKSRERSRLPLAHMDFVYSIIVEEFGFWGGFLVLCTYLSLLWRAWSLARTYDKPMPRMLMLGMALMLVLQALIHIAINVGASPVSGQQLPLISMGGTSAIIFGTAFGIMISVSRSAALEKDDKATKTIEAEALPINARTSIPQ